MNDKGEVKVLRIDTALRVHVQESGRGLQCAIATHRRLAACCHIQPDLVTGVWRKVVGVLGRLEYRAESLDNRPRDRLRSQCGPRQHGCKRNG